MQWDLTRSSLGDSLKGSGKLAGNKPRNLQKKTLRLTARMSEAAGFAGIPTVEPSVSDGCTAITQDFGRLLAVEPPVP
ncbi:hypothetical protein B296_00022409 [Ensete ventricosum]|uniref:Uncharacterized protein n=1 Tax=Ensete ventricosum TaxID=4639 RepID=A0A426XQ97_ENSVE|nr:hypothetical protein B296_00022409 [Ensete ventricosum]